MEERNYIPSPEEISGLATYGQALFAGGTPTQLRANRDFMRTVSQNWQIEFFIPFCHQILFWSLQYKVVISRKANEKIPFDKYRNYWYAFMTTTSYESPMLTLNPPFCNGYNLVLEGEYLYSYKGGWRTLPATKFDGVKFWRDCINQFLGEFFTFRFSDFELEHQMNKFGLQSPFPIIPITQPL